MSTQKSKAGRGLRFRKLDLHLHTPASDDFDDANVTPDQIVEMALSKGLEGIAVTDHNSGAWVDQMKVAGEKRGLAVLPGVEISCMGGKSGVHIIALFDRSCTQKHVDALLSRLGLEPEEFGKLSAIVKKSPLDVVKEIERSGGLAVLAHANSGNGALNEMRGQQRISLVMAPALHAAEGTDFQDESKTKRRKRVVDLLDGTDSQFQRELAVYQASDNPSESGSGHGLAGIGSRCSYFKLEKIDLDGLRQCFNDAAVRLRQDYDYVAEGYPHIRRVSINGGFMGGSSVEFHPGLNSVLGGKGAGKSLLVEFLRFALDQEPSVEEIRVDHEGKLAARLEDFGVITVTLCDETGQEYEIKRTYNGLGTSSVEPSERRDIARTFPVLFLSQNEIIRIAEDSDEQLRFIDRFFDFRSYQRRVDQLEAQLLSIDADMADRFRAFEEERELKAQLAGVKEDIRRLEEKLKNPAFDKYRLQEAKNSSLAEQVEFVRRLIGDLKQDGERVSEEEVPTLPEGLEEDPVLRRVHRTAEIARDGIVGAMGDALEVARKHLASSEEESKKWDVLFAQEQQSYEEQVKSAGGDYKALARQRAERVREKKALGLRLNELSSKTRVIGEKGKERAQLVKNLRSAHEEYSVARRERCERIEKQAAGRLKVTIHERSDRKEFEERLKQLKRGSYVKDAEIEQIVKRGEPTEFMRSVVRYGLSRKMKELESVAEKCEVPVDRMVALAEFLLDKNRYEDLLSLEYKGIPKDRPEIKFQTGANQYAALNEVSVGQKCTALLIVALSDGEMPVVIDQPEDSLDIRSVWEDICAKIRGGKERRQFIFTTHNSSLAVASDTDQFVVIEGTADHGSIAYNGSMDHSPMTEQVITYLEGGEKTYKSKFRKYRGNRLVE